MDKNMIHIDDLIRQRLNGEEEERAGAWLRMKDLLDKDMPNKRVIGFGWRKTLLVSAGVVAAIATVGITGYQMSSRFNSTADNSVTTVANPSYANNKVTAPTAQQQPVAPAQISEAKDDVSVVRNTPNAVAVNSAADKDALNPTTSSNMDVRVRSAEKASNTTKTTTTKSTNTSNNKTIADNTSNNVDTQPQPTISSANTTSNKPGQPADQRMVANDRNENTTATSTVASVPVKMETVPVLNINEKIIVDQRTGTATTTTTEVGRSELQRPVAVAVTTPAPTTTPEPAPAPKEMVVASAKAPYGPPRDEYHSSVENSMFGASARKNASANSNKSGMSVWQHISEYFNRAQYQLGQTKINTGVIGGLNKTFGNYGLLGMNVGMFTDFMFSETWGARLEAKYMHWFNQGTTYRNDFNSYTQEGGLYNQYKNDHTFKYSAMWNVDVPVMLQYRPYKSNVAIFAGANLSYFSKLTPEETNRETLVASGLAQAGPVAAPMTVADFNSRFGMGAILGVGYNVNDMMQVGLRVSQSLTDNAKGANAQQVSKDLYRTPNVQLNFSYRFGKDKKED